MIVEALEDSDLRRGGSKSFLEGGEPLIWRIGTSWNVGSVTLPAFKEMFVELVQQLSPRSVRALDEGTHELSKAIDRDCRRSIEKIRLAAASVGQRVVGTIGPLVALLLPTASDRIRRCTFCDSELYLINWLPSQRRP